MKLKRFLLIFITIFTLFICENKIVHATDFDLGLTVKNNSNGTLTATVGGSIVGKITISVNNKTESVYIENIGDRASKTFKTGEGTFTVTATGENISNANYEPNDAPVVQTKSVKVTIPNNSSTKPNNSNNNSNSNSNNSSSNSSNSHSNTSSSNNATTKPQDTRSSENKLASLSVSAGTLSPAFSADKTSYKVELTSESAVIEVNAKAKDAKATLSGTGKHELKIGENNIVITVKAENGAKKTYTISVYVTERPTVFLELEGQKLGVLNDYSKVDVPKGFEKSTDQIDGKEINVLKNDNLNLSLIYLTNNEGENNFYIYENGQILRKYEIIQVNGKTYILLNITSDLDKQEGLVRQKVKIGDLEIEGWIFADQNHLNYSVVYLMNEAGEKQLYSYEETEGTLQKYMPYAEEKVDNTLLYVFIGTTVLFAVTSLALLIVHTKFKKKSIASVKEYYERKNQGE